MKSKALAQLSEVLKPYWKEVALAIFLTLLPGYVMVWTPVFIARLIDDGIAQNDLAIVTAFGLAILGLKTFQFIFSSMVTYCLSAFGSQILVDYRGILLRRILSYPMKVFDRISAGKLTTRLTSDINTLQELFSSALVSIAGNAFLVVGVLIGMLWMNWKLALASFAILPVLIWITLIFHVRIRRRFGFMRQALSSLNAFSGESFAGSRDLQVFGALETNRKEFERFSEKFQSRFLQAVREYALYNPTVPLITSFLTVIILSYGGFQIYEGTMTVGQVAAFLAYASYLDWPIRDFSEKFTVLQQALAAVDRLVEISQPLPEVDQGKEKLQRVERIDFDRVRFRYESNLPWALDGISFTAHEGQKIALLGETGSGKTTTCSLLMRFYHAQEGAIQISGRSVEEYSLDFLRRSEAWVSQEVTLFSETLRENLRFYDLSINDEEIWKMLEWVQLKSWAQSYSQGLDRRLEERGASLSSGQRQLLSLARALLRKPKILIFDEATSYIDTRTEWQIQKAIDQLFLNPELKGTTAFFIAHRLSTLKQCDQMLVFKSGAIVERGNFESLMAQKGYAHHLFQEQFRRLA